MSDHIVADMKHALSGLSAEELFEIITEASVLAMKTTYNHKKETIKKVAAFAKKSVKRYADEGVLASARSDFVKAKALVRSLPEKTQSVYERFLMLGKEEQIEVVAVTIVTVAIFFTAGGGVDMEGGIPDMDIAAMGIENHRSVFTHSILIGLGVEFAGRFALLILEKIKNRMPANRHWIWDKIYGYIDKHKEKAIAAMWLGIGTHLLKDSGIFGHNVTPYKDLPFSMSMEGHQGLFAANGIASTLFGANPEKASS